MILIEPRERLGGNLISRNIGPFTFDIGSYVFFTGSPFFKRFPAAERLCIRSAMPVERVTPQGWLSSYPYSLKRDLLRQGPAEMAATVLSLLAGRLFADPRRNSGSFARYHLGGRLFESSGLCFYIERLCGIPADQVEARFAELRMQWIALSATPSAVLKRLARKRDASPGPAPSMVRPAAGFEAMFDVVGKELEERGVTVRTGFAIDAIRRTPDGFRLTQPGEQIEVSRLISTLPAELTARLCGFADIPELPSLTLLSLFVKYRGDLGFPSTILYNFAADGRWKRLTVHSRIYGRRDDHEYLSVEVTFPKDSAGVSAEVEFAAFIGFMRDRGLMRDTAELIGHELTDKAYPVYREGASATAADLVDRIGRSGIEMLGRQGLFAYIPTASEATRQAETFVGPAIDPLLKPAE